MPSTLQETPAQRAAVLNKLHRTPNGVVQDSAPAELTDRSLWLLFQLCVRVKRFDFPDDSGGPVARVRESDLRPLVDKGWVHRRPKQKVKERDAGSYLEITDEGLQTAGALVRWARGL